MPVVEAVVVMVVAVVVASEPMTSMPPVPMPATVGVSEVCTEQDQPHDHDEYPHPLLPCSHDHRLSLRVQMLIFPHIVPPISPELPRQSSIWGPRRNRRKISGKPIDACFTIEKSPTKTELMCITATGTAAIDVRLSYAS
jgi:hypothetical protein